MNGKTKQHKSILVMSLMTLLIASCNGGVSSFSSTSSGMYTSFSADSSSDSSSSSAPYSSKSSSSSFSSESSVVSSSEIVSSDSSISSSEPSSSNVESSSSVTSSSETLELVEDSICFSDYTPGKYSSNFGSEYMGEFSNKYNYYRAGNREGNWIFYPSSNLETTLEYSLPGSFSNERPEYSLYKISVTYSGAGVLRYGQTKDCLETFELEYSSEFTTVEVDVYESYFFFVEAGKDESIILSAMGFVYNANKSFSGGSAPHTRYNTRIPATIYEGELIDGVSYVDVPVDVTITENGYAVNETKRYTYYSFDYIYEHQDDLDLSQIVLTDPVDVANYYIAFQCAPVNYAAKNTVDQIRSSLGSSDAIKSLFGSDARYVSQYNRTDGYAVGLPYYGYRPVYLEFDFAACDQYSLSNRDVGRVVLWATGWSGDGYGANIPVATYTDDHYVTFREYNGYGGWNLPFDSKDNGSYTQQRTFYYYGSTVTLQQL